MLKDLNCFLTITKFKIHFIILKNPFKINKNLDYPNFRPILELTFISNNCIMKKNKIVII